MRLSWTCSLGLVLDTIDISILKNAAAALMDLDLIVLQPLTTKNAATASTVAWPSWIWSTSHTFDVPDAAKSFPCHFCDRYDRRV